MAWRIGNLAAFVLAGSLAVAGCQGGASSAPSTPTASASPPSPASAPVPGLVDVGGGRQVFAQCEGSGSPTVVLVSGQDLTADSWRVVADDDSGEPVVDDRAVFQQLASRTRVCAYDRGNTSWPSASRAGLAPQPVSAGAAVTDLHTWLMAAQVPGPYVLAGHSFGGMIAVLYAETYPDEVAGLVLVDPANRYLRDVIDPAWWSDIQKQRMAAVDPEGPEVADFDTSSDQIASAGPVPPVPAVVLTSDAIPPEMIDEEHFPAWQKAHRLLARELDARHVTRTHSGHSIQVEQPDLVTGEIVEVLSQVAGG